MEAHSPAYDIRIFGHLSPQWSDWFGGLTITLEEDGTTLLTGPVTDQTALHGVLKKVRDLGMPLVSVQRVRFDTTLPKLAQETTMTTTNTSIISAKIEPRVLLSTLWIVVLINMLKADVLSLNIPGAAEEVARTAASTGASIAQLMLFGAIIGNLAIAMIILSRVLARGINRWANVVMGIVTIAYIWGGAATYPHYTFIAVIETICLLLIIWSAWKWRKTEA